MDPEAGTAGGCQLKVLLQLNGKFFKKGDPNGAPLQLPHLIKCSVFVVSATPPIPGRKSLPARSIETRGRERNVVLVAVLVAHLTTYVDPAMPEAHHMLGFFGSLSQ